MLTAVFLSFIWAQSTMTSVAAGANNIAIDRFCQCRLVDNAATQAMMVPHKTLLEFASFYNSPPPTATVDLCSGTSIAPTFDIPDMSGAASCPTYSSIQYITGINNNTLAALNVSKTSLANCTIALLINNNYAIANIGNMPSNVSVCEGDSVQLEVSCSTIATHTGTITIEDANLFMPVDDISISLTAASACF